VRARLQSELVGTVEHVLTHRRLQVAVYRALGARGAESDTGRLFSNQELEGVGISTLTRKLLGTALFR
jgi:adenine-specific DNA glycosylase